MPRTEKTGKLRIYWPLPCLQAAPLRRARATDGYGNRLPEDAPVLLLRQDPQGMPRTEKTRRLQTYALPSLPAPSFRRTRTRATTNGNEHHRSPSAIRLPDEPPMLLVHVPTKGMPDDPQTTTLRKSQMQIRLPNSMPLNGWQVIPSIAMQS